MSLRFKKNINYNTIIGLWEIDPEILAESADLNLSENQFRRLDSFGTDRKKAEFLSVISLVRTLLDQKPHVEVKYNANGQPFLEAAEYNISITHSGKFVAILLSKDAVPGIDIEQVSEKIARIEDKFMSVDEMNSAKAEGEHKNSHKVVVWTTKEALFKFYGDGNIIFKENLLVEPFKFDGKGVINASIVVKDMHKKFDVHYEKIDDYILTYVLG
ncbi:MAG TPA: 4'-phosphopantetheinyl transferase superfamily protein [Flavobacteriales bacterium]|nr:4'-phosphopantetheinyl transferase superfamily protein [Flavobacteriales bacterium]